MMAKSVESSFRDGVLTMKILGRVDSSNARDVEADINEVLSHYDNYSLIIDAGRLEYLSSVGLRIVLRLKKAHNELKIINASPEVYDIFDVTGFTEMMTVEKAFRQLSVEGCELIGQGSNGMVYRLDPDTIIKVYKNPDSLEDINRERELARLAFVSGIPTAIPYDVVRVGESYGSVFELLNADSFANIIDKDPGRTEEVLELYVGILKKIHSTETLSDILPSMKETALDWAHFLEGHLPKEQSDKLIALIEAVPERHTMLHGDYHIKNLMMQDDEVLLIDMDTLCYGDPIFEFASIFLAYVGFGYLDPSVTKEFLGISYELSEKIWYRTLELYFETEDKELLNTNSEKAQVLGYTRLLRRTIRREPDNVEMIAYCKQRLGELLAKIDSLCFEKKA